MDFIQRDPTKGIDFIPVKKKFRYITSPHDIDKVIDIADKDIKDYLCVIRDTMARVSEINHLKWDDVFLQDKYIILYTRKKKGGHLSLRKVYMTERVAEILSRLFAARDLNKEWVFWHRYWSNKKNDFIEGPYQDRKKIMRTLGKNAGIKYFRYHPLRHSGASIMEENGIPISAIQKILGHENRTTTEIYLHSIGDMDRNAIQVYEWAIKKSHTEADEKKEGIKHFA